jgi:BCCT family betaine/carnitine transporter
VASLVVIFIILTLWNPVEVKKVFDGTKLWTIENFDLILRRV